jgi:hypothetical protein
MSRRRQKADEFKNLAADTSPEDGGDPKEFHQKPWNAPKKAGRKAQQLCQQVRDALHSAFAACGCAQGGTGPEHRSASRDCERTGRCGG